MTLNKMLIPVGALAVVLSAGVFSAEAQDRGRDRNDRDRQGDQGRNGQARARRDDDRQRGGEARAQRGDGTARRGDGRDGVRDNRQWRSDRRDGVRNYRDGRFDRRDGRFYGPPRVLSPRFAPGRSPYRRYGPGPGLGVYFGLGSGYRYGAPYSGRVYGYSVPSRGYGVRRYYGDVRLEVRPRDAAVYVDGYYAGIVDDFDGVFQRLTLEAGPHRIEIELPGFEPRAFDVAVDPTRTVAVREDLFPEQP
jgi:hypothetical protein